MGFQALVQLAQLLVLLPRQLFEPALFLLQLAPLQRVPHQQQHFRVVPGLGDVAVDLAAVDGADDLGHVGVAGQQDTQGVRMVLAGALEELGAVHLGHAHVRDDQVDLAPCQQGQALAPTVRGQDLVALGAEQAPQRRQDVRLVVDAQDDACRLPVRVHGAASSPPLATWCTGSTMRKVVPFPGSLCTSIRPLCFWMMP